MTTPPPQGTVPAWSTPEGYRGALTFDRDRTVYYLPEAMTGNAPGADDSAAIGAIAQELANSGGGKIVLGPYPYIARKTWQVKYTEPIRIEGIDTQATTIYSYNTGGAAVDIRNPYKPSGGATSVKSWGGGMGNLTIDGSNAGASSSGLHTGDMKRFHFDNIQIAHFNGTTSCGLHVDNEYFWTEDGFGNFHLLDNTTGVIFDVSNSYYGNPPGGQSPTVDIDNNQWWFEFGTTALQSGILVTGGAFLYHQRFYNHGGLRSSSSPGNTPPYSPANPPWCFLQVGSIFDTTIAGDGSGIAHSDMIIQMESDGGNTNKPIGVVVAHGATHGGANAINGGRWYANFMNSYAASVINGQFSVNGFINDPTGTLQTPSMAGLPAANAQFQNNGPPTYVNVQAGTGAAVNITLNGVSTGQATGTFYIDTGNSWGLGNYTGTPVVNYIPAIGGV